MVVELPRPLVETTFLTVPLYRWVLMVVFFALALLLGSLITRALAPLLRPVLRRLTGEDSDQSLGLLAAPIRLLLIALVIRLVSTLSPSLAARFWGRAGAAVAIVGLAWLAIRFNDIAFGFAARRLRRRQMVGKIAVLTLVRRFITATVWVVAALWLLRLAGADLTAVLTGLGIGGIGVAFAAQKTLENLFGGITIIMGTIEIGDTFKNPRFRVVGASHGSPGGLMTFDRAVAHPMRNQDWFTEKDYDADEFNRFPKGAGFPGMQSADWGWVQHILASLNEAGRAAIVLDTGAASRGSGSANTTKEKKVRQWFVDNDLIEGVIYLPENLFYNTTAPGIILFLNKAKPARRKNKVFLLNASREFEKGDPKNYIPDEAIARIAESFLKWREVDKFSRIVSREEIVKNDYNISPSRYIHTADGEEYRPIAEILDDLKALEE